MPNRILRDWTDSERVDVLDVHTERFFVRLIMKVDDFGRYTANCKMLKSTLFPLKTDIRETDIARWLTACEKSDLIALYSVASKEYVEIKNFKQRLRQSVEKYPSPNVCQSNDGQVSVNGLLETEKKQKPNPETETEILSPVGDLSAEPPLSELVRFNALEKNKNSVIEFLRIEPKPTIIEPYIFIWNVFAQENKMSEVKSVSESRKKKFKVRIREKPFDFLEVLRNAKKSTFILQSTWFSFDWIIENENNYLKVLEGNYLNKQDSQQDGKKGYNNRGNPETAFGSNTDKSKYAGGF